MKSSFASLFILLSLSGLFSCGGGGNSASTEACGDCHAVPPASGAHLAHYGERVSPPRALYGDLRSTEDISPGGSNIYLFGCGNCHPVNQSLHEDGIVQVELYDNSVATDSIKSKNPANAVYDGANCSNVYCHSTGQESPAYVTTPAWNGGQIAEPRCNGCHSNPPNYASGGAGTSTANSHLLLADDGFEFGHFAGLPGAWHSSYHGDVTQQAAPITCQTCHFESVDAANTGTGGFYYLDTTGDYNLGGNLGYACSNCHDGQAGSPVTGQGVASPLRHVNGIRDVDFDPRTSIPAGVTGLPVSPNRPDLPYWVTSIPAPLPTGSTTNGFTWSFHLAGASYDPVEKTCSNVPCHLKQSYGTGNPSFEPLYWGLSPVGTATCNHCHQF